MITYLEQVVSDMAEALGEPVDPKWAQVLAKVVPDALGWFNLGSDVRTPSVSQLPVRRYLSAQFHQPGSD